MKEVLTTAITDALKEVGLKDVAFVVEHPDDVSHGDYATNVALVAAKQMGKNPRECAEMFVVALKKMDLPDVADVTIAGPGFINFTLTRSYFSEQIDHILSAADRWGANDTYSKEKILLEYTSPNLFKPLHVGNLVGNIIGESLSRICEYAGADVVRLNYPSDIGLTVAKGVWGLQKTGGDPGDIASLGEAYRVGNQAYEEDAGAKEEIESVNRSLYAGSDSTLQALRAKGLETSRTHLAELCRMFGTVFDLEIFESEAGPVGQNIVKEHVEDGIFEVSDGATVYRGERVGLHTRVFLNSQGLPTYEAKDIGNFVLKDRAYPDWTSYVVVTGQEQREYFKVVFAAIRELFPAYQERAMMHVPTGFLTLSTGKMSSRKGNVLTGEALIADMQERALERAKESRAVNIEELTEQIAVAALKYQMLRQAAGLDIVFDREQALSFEGASGPYLQYTAVRTASVLEKAENESITASTNTAPDAPYDIERILYRFPEAVMRAAADREPHHVTTYLTELAASFNSFYANERIADVSDQYAPYKVALTSAVRQTLVNGLWLLGIAVPEKM